MFPFSVVFLVVGAVWIVFGIRLMLDSGGAAERAAERNRAYRDPRPVFGMSNRSRTYKPKTTLGMRRAGALFALVGAFFVLLAILLA